MRLFDLGSLVRVEVSHHDVADFARRWPGFAVTRGGSFTFDRRTGDLVDTTFPDEGGIVALSEDAWEYARLRMRGGPAGRLQHHVVLTGDDIYGDRDNPPGSNASNPPLERVKQLGPNMTEVEHGDVTILYSYETPVAALVPGVGFLRTSERFSATTSRHIGKWLGSAQAKRVPQSVIAQLAWTGEYRDNAPRDNPPRRRSGIVLGSVSEGTLKTSDLLIAFHGELRSVFDGREMPKDVKLLYDEAGKILADHDADDIDYEVARLRAGDVAEQAGFLVDELQAVLDELAPPYVTFGAHPGDGAAFGWWPAIDALEDDVRSGEVLKVDDMGDVPRAYTGYVMHVSDHGNVTLYDCKRGRCDEVWGAV